MTNGEKFKEVFGYECESDCGCGAFYVDFGTDCPVTQGRKCVTECYYNDWINQEYKGEQKNE
mgnify:CR=1 FL=1